MWERPFVCLFVHLKHKVKHYQSMCLPVISTSISCVIGQSLFNILEHLGLGQQSKVILKICNASGHKTYTAFGDMTHVTRKQIFLRSLSLS